MATHGELAAVTAEQPGVYPDGQLRTLQRRMKVWQRTIAHSLVLGSTSPEKTAASDAAMGTGP